VIDLPGDHPPPYAQLAAQHPLIFTLLAGEILYRHHKKIDDPVYFGKKGYYRFDDPNCPASGCFVSGCARNRENGVDGLSTVCRSCG
jgi:hypothetical protein